MQELNWLLLCKTTQWLGGGYAEVAMRGQVVLLLQPLPDDQLPTAMINPRPSNSDTLTMPDVPHKITVRAIAVVAIIQVYRSQANMQWSPRRLAILAQRFYIAAPAADVHS
jgi:hypothetical protein